ncbi:uncharacterized protein pdgfbb [Osmerus eperlanus]|uniref:uncharacterized protein pdgfbb n=1 Tax=Osmerus eperlanus TaxID=29151 RepID=UPI002E156F93
MSSWVQLLALLVMASLRVGKAEGDSLPAGLEELVSNSPIASIQDLQLLLLSEAPDEDEEGSPSNSSMTRVPRSLDALPAQQALCKVRTEVTEVTRAMLDRSNANFLLWPPCVEVQRCSGCCNTKTLQCVPVLTHTRHLQVMKVQYMNKQPTYAKAVVSVVDHVECRCQPAPRAPTVPKKKPAPNRPGQQGQQGQQGHSKGRSKEELHRRDELKHIQLEQLLGQHWNPHWAGNHSTLQGGRQEAEPVAVGEREEAEPGALGGREEAVPGALGGREEAVPGALADPVEKRAEGGGSPPRYAGTAQAGREQGGAGPPEAEGGHDKHRQAPHTDRPPQRTNTTKQSRPRQENASSEQAGPNEEANQRQENRFRPTKETNQRQDNRFRPTEETNQRQENRFRPTEKTNQRQENRFRPTEKTNQRQENRFRPTEETNQGLKERGRDNDTPGWEGRVGLALLEEERRQQEKEVFTITQQQHPSTTQTADSSTTSPRSPPSTAGPRGPVRPARPTRPAPNPRKRMRKNRKRISKAAMRAMLM